MPRYSEERKAAVLRKLLPPNNQSVPELAKEEGIAIPTLYNWRNQAKERGILMPDSGKRPHDWSPQAQFATLVETASMNEHALSEYCREKGLYPEQITQWKTDFIESSALAGKSRQQIRQETRQDKKRIKQLEQELQRKEKALAETAALLVLRKKINALWEENEDV